ncbi:hypothetical protein ARMSODRAFT_980787 [Armillaria solidipes]|uniref:Uncharacterized protein n=1 Tax=Armillaria solidipes TaxID=1076256 RepID=A0A2H3BES0_9AGAR|nr:hypothetical protein ARMSODRAFT_980787 [Armillaria solidipes]
MPDRSTHRDGVRLPPRRFRFSSRLVVRAIRKRVIQWAVSIVVKHKPTLKAAEGHATRVHGSMTRGHTTRSELRPSRENNTSKNVSSSSPLKISMRQAARFSKLYGSFGAGETYRLNDTSDYVPSPRITINSTELGFAKIWLPAGTNSSTISGKSTLSPRRKPSSQVSKLPIRRLDKAVNGRIFLQTDGFRSLVDKPHSSIVRTVQTIQAINDAVGGIIIPEKRNKNRGKTVQIKLIVDHDEKEAMTRIDPETVKLLFMRIPPVSTPNQNHSWNIRFRCRELGVGGKG